MSNSSPLAMASGRTEASGRTAETASRSAARPGWSPLSSGTTTATARSQEARATSPATTSGAESGSGSSDETECRPGRTGLGEPAATDRPGPRLVPRVGPGGARGPGAVPDERHPAAGGAAHEHPPAHRGHFLCLVDDHVPVRPGAAGAGAVGDGEVGVGTVPPCERFRVDHVVGHEDLRIEVVLDVLDRRAGEDLQGLLRLSELFGPRAVGLAAVGLGILAQEFRELVQEWDVRDGEGLAVLAVEGVLVPGDVVARRLRDPLAAREQV